MSLSKQNITKLINKRRKYTYYSYVLMLQSRAWDDDFNRKRSYWKFPDHYYYPHLGYINMKPKDVPKWVVKDWFEFYLKTPEGRNHTMNVHPRDHEWLLSQLLQ